MTTSFELGLHYQQLWQRTYQQFMVGGFELDPLLLDPVNDTRRGITLLARPSDPVKEKILRFLGDLAQLEPEQYYYPTSDLHTTVLSIISCYNGFTLDLVRPEEYVAVVQKALAEVPPFKIRFRGLTASPSCVLLQGFPEGDALGQLRANLRSVFRTSGLLQSIDQRYAIQTAHSTVVRFKTPLGYPAAFLRKLEEYQRFDFGSFTVDEVELVFNDWYQRAAYTQTIGKFSL